MHECGSTLPHSPMNGGLSILLCFFGSWHQARLSHHLHLFHVIPVFCALAILEPEHVHTHHIHGFAVSGHGTPGSGVVAGHAEVLIVPNLESGNMLAKELTFIAHAEAAGLVVGAKVPIMLTSRADDGRARLTSCAIALLYAHWQAQGAPVEVLEREAD